MYRVARVVVRLMGFRLGIAAALLCAAPTRAQDGTRPNFVIVLVDDLRWDGVGVTGHPFVDTPNIDEIARDGVVFRNAFVTTPLCAPSRASFLSGRYARSHGVLTNGHYESLHSVRTFPELLEGAGYTTAFIGKWHIGPDAEPRPGFTRWISFPGQGDYSDQALNIDGRTVSSPGYLTDVLNQHAVDFVHDAVAAGHPFALYLSHKAVHEPFIPPPRHVGLYAEQPVLCSPGCNDTLSGKRALTRFVPGSAPPVPGRTGLPAVNIREQMSLLVSVDQGVGALVRALRSEGVLDRTLMVFTSDNGYFHREHGLGDKRWAYEESIRIPLVVRYPPLATRGVTIDALVLNVDLAPTILELAGSAPLPAIDGRSLLPLFEGAAADWRTSALFEYFTEEPFPRIPTWEAVRTDRFKLIRYPELGRGFEEIYDLTIDPFELTNRFDSMDYSAVVERLETLLDTLIDYRPDKSARSSTGK